MQPMTPEEQARKARELNDRRQFEMRSPQKQELRRRLDARRQRKQSRPSAQ